MIYVGDLMTSKVFSLRRTDTLGDVRLLMNMAKVRHIPVVDADNCFLGLVTHRDLLAYAVSRLADIEMDEQAELEASIMVGDIMRVDTATTTKDTLLRDAAEQLYHHKYGCLPVVEDRKLVGIITEADFLRLAIALLHQI